MTEAEELVQLREQVRLLRETNRAAQVKRFEAEQRALASPAKQPEGGGDAAETIANNPLSLAAWKREIKAIALDQSVEPRNRLQGIVARIDAALPAAAVQEGKS